MPESHNTILLDSVRHYSYRDTPTQSNAGTHRSGLTGISLNLTVVFCYK